MAIYKHWYIDCKDCGRRITLETYTGEAVFSNRGEEELTCPACLKEFAYSGDDFRTTKLF